MPNIQTATLARAFLYNWVARFGVPHLLTYNRGAQFTSTMWASMSSSLGMNLAATTAYHWESNGMVERMHSRLKEALKHTCRIFFLATGAHFFLGNVK